MNGMSLVCRSVVETDGIHLLNLTLNGVDLLNLSLRKNRCVYIWHW